MAMPTPVTERQYDPDNFISLKFFVEIDGILVATFSECSGMTIETEIEEYKEGGLNLYSHKLPGRTKYSNITLKRGIDPGNDLYSWYVSAIDGNTKRQHQDPGQEMSRETGKNVSIILYGPSGNQVKRWNLRRAFPVKWSGPDLKSDAGAAAVETLEFAHEGILLDNTFEGPFGSKAW